MASGAFSKAWRRIAVATLLGSACGYLLAQGWTDPSSVIVRAIALGLVAAAVFSVFEVWPHRLPRFMARWALQVIAVGVCVPVTTIAMWILSTAPGAPPFWEVPARMDGIMMLTFFGLLVAPWTALAALVRQREAMARHQALSFALERSELERQALDARLHLLQAQVAPHFLFNTLANVQALVDTGSPRASEVLRSLVAYLRAAVPLLHESAASVGRELELVRAYLELMHMRMPDRLRFQLRADPSALTLRCPPTTILTLVENAVRHGVDPAEEGGAIEVDVRRNGDRCLIRVSDTGAGFRAGETGLGTGLAALRERLELMFGGEAHLTVVANEGGGVRAEVAIPARAEARS
jgi:signal transduction histidine kinase